MRELRQCAERAPLKKGDLLSSSIVNLLVSSLILAAGDVYSKALDNTYNSRTAIQFNIRAKHVPKWQLSFISK